MQWDTDMYYVYHLLIFLSAWCTCMAASVFGNSSRRLRACVIEIDE